MYLKLLKRMSRRERIKYISRLKDPPSVTDFERPMFTIKITFVEDYNVILPNLRALGIIVSAEEFNFSPF
jgi:hypothetical protein